VVSKLREATTLPIDKRLEFELKVINEFKEEVGVIVRADIGETKEKIRHLKKTLKDAENYTKASKAYLNRAIRRVLSIYNSHLRRLEDLHVALFLDE